MGIRTATGQARFGGRWRRLPSTFGAACAALLIWAVTGAQAQSPPAAPSAEAKPQAEAKAEAEAEPRFDILAFNVKGNTRLSVPEIEAAVYPFMGERRRIADAEGARAALERVYQARGFLSVAVTLPPQTVDTGEVLLEVVEAQVGQRRVTGARWFLPSRIAEQTPALAPGTVPDFEQVQAQLAQLQTAPDLRLTPVITPGATPDRIDVELRVEDTLPLHGHAELSSRQSYNTDRGRLDAQLRYDNLFQRGHSAGLTLIVAPTALDQSRTAVFSYALPVDTSGRRGGGADRGRLSLTGIASDSNTPTSLGGSTVVQGSSWGLGWRQPLRSLESGFSHGWSAGADWKHNRDRSEVSPGLGGSPGSLRYWAFRLGWDAYDSRTEGSQTQFDAQLGLGLSGINRREVDCAGRSRVEQFECKRSGARPDWQLLRLNASHRRTVFSNWALQLRLQAQLAGDPLSSGEQLGAGGLDSVRGYYEFEQVADQGVVLGAQLGTPVLMQLGPLSLSALAFAEGATLRVNEPLPAEQADIRLLGVGVGLRASSREGLSVALDLAWPLRASVKPDASGRPVPASGEASNNRQRVDLSVRQAF